MIPYFMNEAQLLLPEFAKISDRTYHQLQMTTQEGVEFDLGVSRAPLSKEKTLRETVQASLESARRKLVGFRYLGADDRDYELIQGIEVRLSFTDEGPIYHHQFHCAFDGKWLTFIGSCELRHREECDEWMIQMVGNLRFRAE